MLHLLLTLTLAWGTVAAQPIDTWDLDPANAESVRMRPERETARTADGLELAYKRFARPGAQPVLLIHGLAQNDRSWDSPVARYAFGRFMHAQGFDVWIGNLRGAGTRGYESEMPRGPHHWTIDDYSAYDIPALVDQITRSTGQKPFVIGHSLAAWALEGYLGGLSYDSAGRVAPRAGKASQHVQAVRGVATIAGVYAMRWEFELEDAAYRRVRTLDEFYHSNYELELLARIKPLYHVIPHLYALPLGWIGDVLWLPLERIPYIGGTLSSLYAGIQNGVIRTPILSMFFYSPNSDQEMVRQHARDGLEDFGPRVIEQLANAVTDHRTSSYYHIARNRSVYDYASVRGSLGSLPMLFVGGSRDRLASQLEIFEDGYQLTRTSDKQYLPVQDFGHLDIITGVHAPSEVMAPIARWMQARR